MTNNDDKESVDRVKELLQVDGFEITKAEDNPEYIAKLGNYTKTPDLIEYPFIGGGSPNDFFIDVKCPIGDYLWKAVKSTKEILNQSWDRKENLFVTNKTIELAEIQELTESINHKTEKYKRDSSPLFGLVYYFDLRNSKIPSDVSVISGSGQAQINWHLSTQSNKDDFQKELYLYLVFVRVLDSIMGTSLVVNGTVTSKEWERGIVDTFDTTILKLPIKRFIQVPHHRFHSNSSFLMLIVDLPSNVQQEITFYNSPLMTTKIWAQNKIIQHMRKLINGAAFLD